MTLADGAVIAGGIAGAVLLLAVVAVGLAVQVLILRAGLEPVREQLQRIADEIEVRNDVDASEDDQTG